MDSIAFWAALAVTVVAIAVTGYFGRMQSERTIRQAIEKGLLTDAGAIERLRRSGLPWAQRLTVIAIIVLFGAAGLAVFALSLLGDDAEAAPPLLGIAAFVAFVGAGMFVAGRWLRREDGRG
jgi:predicted hotdog family 3-hydroxylacyl-ACP dehydratase